MTSAAACGDDKKPVDEPPPVPALEIVTAALPDVMLGQAYDQKIQAKGGEPPYTFSLSSGLLPQGLEVKEMTGQIAGLAGTPGKHELQILVKDSKARHATKSLSLYVVPDPLMIVTEMLPMGQQGVAYGEDLHASGGVEPYEWSVSDGALPNGIMLGTNGHLIGMATEYGAFTFNVRVTDAEMKKAERRFMLALASLDPMIQTSTIPKARLGQPYSVEFTADGGKPPYSWSIAGGALPDGLALTAGGTLSGAPTVSGDFMFMVLVTDAAFRSATAGYMLRVIPPLAIETASLPQVIRGRAVQFALLASGGVPPYDWAIRSGTLPAGMMLGQDGVISGSTTDTGEFEITVRVRDSEGAQKSALFTLSVGDRFIYDAAPAIAFPRTCTGTTAQYASGTVFVTESMQIDDLDVSVHLRYTDTDPERYSGDLKLELHAPDGTYAVLCGRNAGIRERGNVDTGCVVPDDLNTSYDDLRQPDQNLSLFRGMNPQGTWRLYAIVANPSRGGAGGQCRQRGTLESFQLRLRDDRSTDPYVVVRGIQKNNLIVEPWVRIRGRSGLPESELFLSATIYNVGPNGFREGGEGDDVPDPTPMMWGFQGPGQVATVTPDGHVQGGTRTGSGRITASGGGFTYDATLLVAPPDFNRALRQY